MLDDKSGVETSAWIEGSGLSLTAWGNLALRATDGETRMWVTGMSLVYSRDCNKLTIESAVEAYRWPEDLGSRKTIEAALKLSYRVCSFQVFGNHAVDMLAEKGTYFGEAGLVYERHIAQRTEVALQGSSGGSSKFNDANIGVAKPAVNFLSVETSLTQYVTPHLYIRPRWTFSTFGFATAF